MLARTPIVVALISAAALVVHAQRGSRVNVQPVGLPAIDVGLSMDTSRAPGTPRARARAVVQAALRDGGRLDASRTMAAGRVIVRFRNDATPSARAAAVRAVARGGTIGARPSYADFDLVRIDAGENPEAVANALKTQHADVVENAQAAYRAHTMFKPNDPLYTTQQWNLPYLNLEPAWDIQPTAGSNITVAVIDTGAAFLNASFTANIPGFTVGPLVYPPLTNVAIPFAAADQLVNASTPNRFVSPYDFIWDDNLPLDFVGHGTHVAGTIGQITNDNAGPAGVAFNVKLMPVKVIDDTWDILLGSPYEGSDDTVARGIRWAVDHGAKVLNMSIGRTGLPSFVVEDAIRYAVGKGAFVAVAAGNEYLEGNPVSVYAEICSRVNGAVSVAAIDRNKRHASYSTAGAYVEIAAPGGDGSPTVDTFVVQQTYDLRFTDTFFLLPSQYRAPRFDVLGFFGYAGTSMAAPHVAGAAAILMQQGITSPAAIEDALKRTAVDLGAAGRDNFFGAGLVNVRNAMFGVGAAK